jgi:hypothetical protein
VISAATVDLYVGFYAHDRTTGTTYINDNKVFCILETILTEADDALVAAGTGGEVIDSRVAFQTDTEDEFTATIERLNGCRVVAFVSPKESIPGVACEVCFLDSPPITRPVRGSSENE